MYYDSMAGNLGGDVSPPENFRNIEFSDCAKIHLKLLIIKI